MQVKPGNTIEYISYGVTKTGVVAKIGNSGTVFLVGGKFLFPESITKILKA